MQNKSSTNHEHSKHSAVTHIDIDSSNVDSLWIMSLPVVASILVIATLPPFNLWPLGFFSIAPIYFFIKINRKASTIRLMLGGFIFSFIFSTFLMAQTVLQFHWVKEAYLFSLLVKLSCIPLLIVISLFSSLNFLILRWLLKKNELLNIFSIAFIWTLSEWLIQKCMFSIEYSILGYPAHNTFFTTLAGAKIGGIAVGGVFLTVFFVAFINTAIGSLFFYIYRQVVEYRATKYIDKKQLALNMCAPFIVLVLAFSVGYIYNYNYSHDPVHDINRLENSDTQNYVSDQSQTWSETQTQRKPRTRTLKIAIIQDQDRTGETFGKEIHSNFHFKTLEDLIKMANEQSSSQLDGKAPANGALDILIYPFAPWDGVIYDKEKDSAKAAIFNKDVFAVSFQAFGLWEKSYVASTTVFATWATTFRDDKFYNEVTYWKDGELLGVHQKEHLFPFLDYTPPFAQKYGLYTTAVDGTPGTTTLHEKIGGVQIGALVCSEVTHPVSDSTSRDSDLILSIGSEAFFTSGIAGDLNVANAAYRAAESGKPVIRANRFGPSAFIDQTGKTVAYMPFGVTGVLVHTITVPVR